MVAKTTKRRDGKPDRAQRKAQNSRAFKKIIEQPVRMVRPRGGQTEYTPERAQAILDMISHGMTLTKAAAEIDMSLNTVRQWVVDDREGFAVRYARAKDLQFEAWEDQQIDLADDCVPDPAEISKVKLQSDNRRWLMGKLKIGKYGDKLQHEGGDPARPIRTVVSTSTMTEEEAAAAYYDAVRESKAKS